jgi:hypothetical protein
VRGR